MSQWLVTASFSVSRRLSTRLYVKVLYFHLCLLICFFYDKDVLKSPLTRLDGQTVLGSRFIDVSKLPSTRPNSPSPDQSYRCTMKPKTAGGVKPRKVG